MILLAHINGLPVEELLLPWASSGLGPALVSLLGIVTMKALRRYR